MQNTAPQMLCAAEIKVAPLPLSRAANSAISVWRVVQEKSREGTG
jgi:hypothetical protein